MTKHTPGPWTIHWNNSDYRLIKRTDDQDATPIARVDVYAPTDGDMEAEGKANAILIAAAPRMKEALEEIAKLSDVDCDMAATFARQALADIEPDMKEDAT